MSNSNQSLVMFEKPLTVAEAVAKAPDLEKALGWGVQSMVAATVRHMVLLASNLSEHYRYSIGLSGDIAQYLYDAPEGAITDPNLFLRTAQVDTLIGHFDNLEVHVIQEAMPEEDSQCLMLLVQDDDRMVVGYLLTRLRDYADHVNVNNVLPKSKAAQ
ncbi:hypothetical protein D3C81_1497720 [compost metagenome]